MKKKLLSSIFCLTLIAACNQKPQGILELDSSITAKQEVIAKVANANVYQNELSSYVKSRTQQEYSQMNREVQKNLFDEFIQLETLSREALAKNLHATEDFTIEVHNLKKNLLAQALLKKFEQDNPVTDAELNSEYQNSKKSFEIPQLKARHILLKTEDEANAIIAELRKKKTDFAELAKTKSTGPSGPNGGDLGWFSPAQMVPEFSDATLALEKGSFSQEPVKTQFGFHVILKEDERIAEAPPLENLRSRLEQEIKKQRLEKYIKDLRGELNVEEYFNSPPDVKNTTDTEDTNNKTEIK